MGSLEICVNDDDDDDDDVMYIVYIKCFADIFLLDRHLPQRWCTRICNSVCRRWNVCCQCLHDRRCSEYPNTNIRTSTHSNT